jgi:hypothetical protein
MQKVFTSTGSLREDPHFRKFSASAKSLRICKNFSHLLKILVCLTSANAKTLKSLQPYDYTSDADCVY